MEQLEDIILAFDAFAKGGGKVAPFALRVARPIYDGRGGCYCEVECHFLSDSVFKMYGADEEQACELTIKFVRQRIEDIGAELVDEDGAPITLPEIDFKPEISTD